MYPSLVLLCLESYGAAKVGVSKNPVCEHGEPSKVVQVKKEGRNKVFTAILTRKHILTSL